jgi:hypothetical protein
MADEEKTLTWDDVEQECDKVGDFFNRLPEELRPNAATRFVQEMINWGGWNRYEAMGICMEALLSHREVDIQLAAEDQDDEHGPHDEVPSDLPPGV